MGLCLGYVCTRVLDYGTLEVNGEPLRKELIPDLEHRLMFGR